MADDRPLFPLCIDAVHGDRFTLEIALAEDSDDAEDEWPSFAPARHVWAVASQNERGVLELVDNGYRSLDELCDAWPALRPKS